MLKHLILAVSVSLLAIACGGGQEQAATPADATAAPPADAKPAEAAPADAKPADPAAAPAAPDAPK